MTYQDRVANIESRLSSFIRKSSLFTIAHKDGAWSNSPAPYTIANLTDMLNFRNSLHSTNSAVDATLFDIPMSGRIRDKNGMYGGGAPSNIGFTQDIDNANGIAVMNYNGLSVGGQNNMTWYASSENTNGDKIYLEMINSKMKISAGGTASSSTAIEIDIDSAAFRDAMENDALFLTVANGAPRHNLFVFTSVDYTGRGAVLYITADFLHWNIHYIVPGLIGESLWGELTGDEYFLRRKRPIYTTESFILSRFVNKCLTILPNNNYIVSSLYTMYKHEDDGVSPFVMGTMYSPFSDEPICDIYDPYDTGDYQRKAIAGTRGKLLRNGEFVYHYNECNIYEETPMVLYGTRIVETIYDGNELENISKVGKFKGNYSATGEIIVNPSDTFVPEIVVGITEDASMLNTSIVDYGNNSTINLYNSSVDFRYDIDSDSAQYASTGNVDQNNIYTSHILSQPVKNIRFHTIAYGNGMFIAPSTTDKYIAISNDGVEWALYYNDNIPIPNTRAICFGPDNKIVIIGRYSSSGAYSYDGYNWTAFEMNNVGGQVIKYCNNKYILVLDSNNTLGMYSFDGVLWTDFEFTVSRARYDICYNGEYIVVVGGAVASETVVEYSTDGLTWNVAVVPVPDMDNFSTFSIAYGGGKWVINPRYSAYSCSSKDLISWTFTLWPNPDIQSLSMVHENGVFVSIDYSGNLYAYSLDGINWIIKELDGGNRAWRTIVYGSDRYVICDDLTPNSNTTNFANIFISNLNQDIKINNTSIISTYTGETPQDVTQRLSIFGSSKQSSDVILNNNPNAIVQTPYLTPVDIYDAGSGDTSYQSIAYGNGIFIATSSTNDRCAYSYDGVTWTTFGPDSNSGREWREVVYADGKFIITGRYGQIATSYDGRNWYIFKPDEENSASLRSICYGNGLFVIFANGSPTCYISENGFEWEPINVPSGSNWIKVRYLNNRFIAIIDGASLYATSTDGRTWTSHTNNLGSARWYNIIYVNGVYYMNSVDKHQLAKSIDGLTWEWLDIGLTESDTIQSVYFNKIFFIVSASNDNLYYSKDGETWSIYQYLGYKIKAFTENGNHIVAVAGSDINKIFNLWELEMAPHIKWNDVVISDTIVGWWETAYGNDKYVMVTYAHGSAALSSDGYNWKVISDDNILGCGYICYGNGTFVGLKYNTDQAVYSDDGVFWTVVNIINDGINRLWRSIVYAQGKFIAVNDNSKVIAYSVDGITWTSLTLNIPDNVGFKIVYGNGKFIATGMSTQYLIYSSDGLTWTSVLLQAGSDTTGWYALSYGGGQFTTICALTGNMYTSIDGITWILNIINSGNFNWYSAAYGMGIHAINSRDANVLTISRDGSTWFGYRYSSVTSQRNSIYVNGKFIISSHYGTCIVGEVIDKPPT